ncbi:MAG: hypothetical protein HUJ94_05585 [Bacteroidales bacterium]|nr:hypothetical protein [Bacteroidales bacterium]
MSLRKLLSIAAGVAIGLACSPESKSVVLPDDAVDGGGQQKPGTETIHTAVGGNFNENIEQIEGVYKELKAEKIPYIRSFINITPWLKRDANGITGVKTYAVEASDLMKKFAKIRDEVPSAKLVLSIKTVFENLPGEVPGKGSAGVQYIFDCVEMILNTESLGEKISVLVLGNEPMWENGEKESNIQNYADFLNAFANKVAEWKKSKGWSFEVYAGALNRFSVLHETNPLIPSIVNVVNSNKNIDGIDLHIHAESVDECENSLNLVRGRYKVTKKIMCSEISMVWKLGKILKNNTQSGWLDDTAKKAIAGNAINRDEFANHFKSVSGYPHNWFRSFSQSFDKYKVSFVTARFSAVESDVVINNNTTFWELGALYSARFLGRKEDGTMQTSPLVYDDYAEYISSK